MKYVGGKERLAKYLLPIIIQGRVEGQYIVEPFGGGGNITQHFTGNRVYNDVNECLVACLQALSEGWQPPKEITRGFYSECRTKYNTLSYTEDEKKIIGYVGINGSYGGRYYDGGYAGITCTKLGKERNYPLEAYNNVTKQFSNSKMKGVTYISGSYLDLNIPPNSIIYCDPPYKGTKEYIEAKKSGFDSDKFWKWCFEMKTRGHVVYVSEYKAPPEVECVWEKVFKSSLSANGVCGGSKLSVERLFKV